MKRVNNVILYNKRTDKALLDSNAIYIGRPGPYGNPFKIGEIHNGIRLNRIMVLDCYEDWLLWSDQGQEVLKRAKKELIGKNLICWCVPEACHGEILIKALTQ